MMPNLSRFGGSGGSAQGFRLAGPSSGWLPRHSLALPVEGWVGGWFWAVLGRV